MITTNLTLDERFEWLKLNKPDNATPLFDVSWPKFVESKIKAGMYTYCFNHQYYVGSTEITDDELRHTLLDELNVPRIK